MSFAAVIFLSLGILVIGFGLLSLCNIFNMPLTDQQAKHADLTSTSFQRAQVRIMLLGAVLLAIGLLLAWLTSG